MYFVPHYVLNSLIVYSRFWVDFLGFKKNSHVTWKQEWLKPNNKSDKVGMFVLIMFWL